MNKFDFYSARPKITIRGRVTLDGAPVSIASVRLVGTRGSMARLRRAAALDPEGSHYSMTVATDERGFYRFRDVPVGEYTLEASAPGTGLFSTGFSTESSLTADIALKAAPVAVAAAAAMGPFRRLECGVNIDPANPAGNPSGADVRGLGATWVRFVFRNDPGQSLSDSFAQCDPVITDMHNAGVNVLLILNNQSFPGKPAREDLDSQEKWRSYIAGFAGRCGEVAAHYRDNAPAYQIWNEPDHNGHEGYDPTVRPRLYGEMLRAAFQAMRPLLTKSVIVTAGMASGNPLWVRDAMAATDKKLFADALAVHPYGRRPVPQWPNPTWGGLPLPEMTGFLQGYRAVANKPIWVTEFGTEDQQTRVAGQGGAFVLASDLFPEMTFESVGKALQNQVTKFFWFCWSDGMVGGFGLLDAGGQPKGAFNSFRSYATRPSA